MTENPYTSPAEGAASPTSPDCATFSAAVLIGMCAALAGIAWISTSARVPAIHSPFPLLVILPYFFGVPLPIIATLAAGVFALTHIRHFKRKPRPKPSPAFTVLLMIVTGLTVVWMLLGWSYSLGYHGAAYTVGVGIANLLFATITWAAWWASRQPARYRTQVVFGFLLFAWMFSFALPYLGELP